MSSQCGKIVEYTPTRRSCARWRANLNLSWIKDKGLEDSAALEDPDVIAEEIADDLQAALEQFATIATDLRPRG